MCTLMIPHSLFLLETEDGVEAIQDECQSPLAVAHSTHIRRGYTKPVFTGFPYSSAGIEQLLQICIYMLIRAVTLV